MLAEVRRLWDHARWADQRMLAAFEQNQGEPPEAWREFSHVIGTAETCWPGSRGALRRFRSGRPARRFETEWRWCTRVMRRTWEA